MAVQKGKVTVNTENIFPIIKKFLYTDHEIFLRELISNAVDATQKVKALNSKGDSVGSVKDLKIKVTLNETKKTLTISDMGIGMTADEIDRFINQIAFSGAEEFVEKFKDDQESADMIGHFGLGFYSSFMVADKVEIRTLSYLPDSESALWVCEGTTDFRISKGRRKKRGTDVILHINEDSSEFLATHRIQTLLDKYCKFLPIEIEFDKKIINEITPLWKKAPADLKEGDYTEFYNKLYPLSDAPLFWIHLNVDYPFKLTGVLYFPKIQKDIDPNRNKIQLYSNQVYVTDNVEDIVPEYLLLLHGVIDSPDIPLNISRSALQADGNVKKITGHISKKVADKLADLHKGDQKDYEAKWSNISVFVKYGMISDEKFYDRTKDICMVKDTDGKYHPLNAFIEEIKVNQTDKTGQTIVLYATDVDTQYTYISNAKDKGFQVLMMDEIIDNHFISNMEQKLEKVQMKRVDADTLNALIEKDESADSVLTEADVTKLKESFESHVNSEKFEVKTISSVPGDDFITITRSEWERRMSEMQGMGSGMAMFGNMPEKYVISLNTNHPLSKKLLGLKGDGARKNLMNNAFDLAKLGQNLLKGKELADYIKRQSEKL